MRATIVVPTNRAECIGRFLEAWASEFAGHRVIVIEDNPEKTFKVPEGVVHVCWEDIDKDLGSEKWIIPRRSGGIRNYGFLLAAGDGSDMIVTLDDDCLPQGAGFVQNHWFVLNMAGKQGSYFDTLSLYSDGTAGMTARGFPRRGGPSIPTVLNHGMWDGIPDLDGETQLRVGDIRVANDRMGSVQIGVGVVFPMSSMNLAFKPEILPAMYMMPMGLGQPYNRFDDIWCGLIMKRACDRLGLAVRCGVPSVRHERASSARRNASIEAPGLLVNEDVWKVLSGRLPDNGGKDVESVLTDIHSSLRGLGPYFVEAAAGAKLWRDAL